MRLCDSQPVHSFFRFGELEFGEITFTHWYYSRPLFKERIEQLAMFGNTTLIVDVYRQIILFLRTKILYKTIV